MGTTRMAERKRTMTRRAQIRAKMDQNRPGRSFAGRAVLFAVEPDAVDGSKWRRFMLQIRDYSDQSMGSMPLLTRKALVFEKCLQPKKPLSAEKGEGWAALRTRCLVSSTRVCFSCANLPHSKKTTSFFPLDILLMTASVNSAQPILLWLMGSLARTVSEA